MQIFHCQLFMNYLEVNNNENCLKEIGDCPDLTIANRI